MIEEPPPRINAGDRVQVKGMPNPPKGVVIQQYAAGSRLALVRWDDGRETSVEKAGLYRSTATR